MVARIDRQTFLEKKWFYRPGEHVSLIEPTQGGKTFLMMQLLAKAMEDQPHLRIVSMMPKPRDPATSEWAETLGLKSVTNWPPKKKLFGEEPNGYVLWPQHIPTDEKANREHLAGEFKKCLNTQYWEGDSITIADDVYLHAVLYGLNPELERHWTAGAGGGAGLWAANQKPTGSQNLGSVSTFSYNSPTHLFIGKDRDARNIKRFSEIGGIDPEQVAWIVQNDLRMHQINGHTVSDKLYIDKRGPYSCIVTP